MVHEKRCDNGCIRRMDIEKVGEGHFSHYPGTLDCPAQVDLDSCEFETIKECGCCSFDDGKNVKTPEDCKYGKPGGPFNFVECNCHNTPIIYASCASKRAHGCCPYGLKNEEE